MKKRIKPEEKAGAAAAVTVLPRPAQVDEGVEMDIDIDRIETDDRNDRLISEDPGLDELADSMAARGLLQPIVVGIVADRGGAGGVQMYRMVAGHRRRKAAKYKLGWKTIRAKVRTYANDEDLQLDRAVENIHRLELNPVEEAYAVAGMIDATLGAARQAMADDALSQRTLAIEEGDDVRFLAMVRRKAIEMVAARLGKSPTWVTDRSYLSRLEGPARQLVLDGRLPLTYAREICKVADPKRRTSLAQRFAAEKGIGGRPGDFDDLRSAVADSLMSLAQVPWRLDVAFAGGPACQSCPKNSANQPRLFEHVPPSSHGTSFGHESFKEPVAGVCTDRECFKEKSTQANRALAGKGGSIARRVAALPKAERPAAVTAKDVADLGAQLKVDVPRFLDPSDLAARVKEEMTKKRASSVAASGGSTQPAKKSAAQEAKEKAERELRDALRERQNAIEKKVLDTLAKDPLRTAVMALVSETRLWGDLSLRWGDKAVKAAKSPALNQLINAIADPTFERIKELGKQIKLHGIGAGAGFGDVVDFETDVVDRVAEALGVQIPPRPTLDEFLAVSGGSKAEKKATPGTCRECGCTEDEACPGGCSWVDDEQTLCSTCAERPDENLKAKKAKQKAKKKGK